MKCAKNTYASAEIFERHILATLENQNFFGPSAKTDKRGK